MKLTQHTKPSFLIYLEAPILWILYGKYYKKKGNVNTMGDIHTVSFVGKSHLKWLDSKLKKQSMYIRENCINCFVKGNNLGR